MTSEHDAGVAAQSSGTTTYSDTYTDTADTQSGGTGKTLRTTASTAADQGRRMADTAKAEAQNVAGTAARQTRSVMSDAAQQVSGQVNDQAAVQRDKLSQMLRTLSDDLEQMASQGQDSGVAADLARELAERARAFGSRLEGREPAQLLDDVRDVARRHPGTFLLGALAAGVVAGRLFRATADGMAAAQLAGSPGRHTEIDTSAAAPGITPVLPPESTPGPTVGDTTTTSLSGQPTLGTP
jgi:gas vesicle protein